MLLDARTDTTSWAEMSVQMEEERGFSMIYQKSRDTVKSRTSQ
jgi:hypothetical protein